MATQPFFGMVGAQQWIYPLVALAALATVIASQALISGVFSMTAQAIQLTFFPRVTVTHTSRESEGQIYLPLLNTGLAIACILLVLVYRSSIKLAGAFGLAVSGTMLVTSLVYWVVARQTWKWSAFKAGAVVLLFLSFDVPYVLANTLKFFDGGYIPFVVGVFFTLVMTTWRAGRGLLADVIGSGLAPLSELPERLRGAHRTPGLAIYMASQANGTPPVLDRVLRRFSAAREKLVLLTVIVEHVPEVEETERFEIAELDAGLYRLTIHFGFMEQPDVPPVVARALASIGLGDEAERAVYVLGRETFLATDAGRMGRRREAFFAWMARNARAATDHFGLPPTRVVEVGEQIDL